MRRLVRFCKTKCMNRGGGVCNSCALANSPHYESVFRNGIKGDGSHIRYRPKNGDTSCLKESRTRIKKFIAGHNNQWFTLRKLRKFIMEGEGITEQTTRVIIQSLERDGYVDKKHEGKGSHFDTTHYRRNKDYGKKKKETDPTLP